MRKALVIIAAAVVFAFIGGTAPAEARVVQLTKPQIEKIGHDPVMYVKHVKGPWLYIELADGSSWMATPCKYEDGRNCWWNAKRRGNHHGRSYLTIHNVQYFTVKGTVIE